METTFKGLISVIYSVWKHLYCKLENYLTSLHCMELTSSDSEDACAERSIGIVITTICFAFLNTDVCQKH